MVERKISKEKYILAAFITFLIFSLGVVLGLLIDNMRANSSEQKLLEQDASYKSLQLQYLFIDTFEEVNGSCEVVNVALQEAVKDLSKSLEEFQTYSKSSHLDPARFNTIHRKYIQDNLRYWLLTKNSIQKCGLEIVPTLYFYSEKNCPKCPNQGTYLTYYKKKFGDSLLVFPIDFDMIEIEPLISILYAKYNVSEFPTLVMGDVKYSGLIEKEQLGTAICSNFEDHPLCKE